jgi:hypothetical protein
MWRVRQYNRRARADSSRLAGSPGLATPADEAGYFGRQCPDPECRTFFKLSVAEYEAATGMVAATQTLAERLHAQAGKAPPKDNPWQNVDRLQRQWLADFAQDPIDGLDAATVRTLRRYAVPHSIGRRFDRDVVVKAGHARRRNKKPSRAYRAEPETFYRNIFLVRLVHDGRCSEFTECFMKEPAAED